MPHLPRLWLSFRSHAATILRPTALVLLGSLALATSAHAQLPGRLVQLGHDPLQARGLNTNLALSGSYAYVGSFADPAAPGGGLLVVDVGNPRRPRVVRRIGAPRIGPPGSSSVELRVWHRRRVLVVMNDRCRPPSCAASASATYGVRFFDVRGRRAAHPRLLGRWRPGRQPHEFFLWEDPRRPHRALLYVSTPAPSGTNVVVADISRVREGRVREIARWRLPTEGLTQPPFGVHSLSVSPDGRRAYAAAFDLGFIMLDTSDFAAAESRPRIKLLTPLARRVTWPTVNAHSAVPLVGGRYALVADEVYGCPWGWARVIDVRRPRRPRVVAEARVPPYNDPAACTGASIRASFSTHNPTIVDDLALISWYGSGLQAWSLRDPRRPRRLAAFVPSPLPVVRAEHPDLSGDAVKVVTTSYPVVRDGLVYLVDMRNGLYVLRYRGPLDKQVGRTRFVEGNSNLTRPR